MMQKYCLLLVLISIFSGCGKQQVPSVKHEVVSSSHIPLLRQFQAEIEGVECAVCAQDVVDLMKTIPGVDCADFILKNNDYEQGYVRFYYDVSSKNIDLRLLDQLLNNQGFELGSLRGAFYIEPFSADGQKYVALNDDIAMPFSYANHVELLKKMIAMSPEKLFAEGSIAKDPQGAYFFTLLGQG
jgi:hypothetical protein